MNAPDQSALFLNVIYAHKGIIFKVANSYCKDPESRKDLMQEIILQLWRSFDRYDQQYRYSTWLYRIALNVAISYYRKTITRRSLSIPLIGDLPLIEDSHAETQSEYNLHHLQQFIAGLKDLDKALMLLYLEERSYKEIAEIMGITETNVATKISRIKTILKQNFLTLIPS